ncbi:hypothetical protein EK904_009904 [Melospiza melodia maxima]|nr:hypothetical protein EK904_009904 [Melospiza melodia maxima]
MYRDAGSGLLFPFMAPPLHLPGQQASLLSLLNTGILACLFSTSLEPYTFFRGTKTIYLEEWTIWLEISNTRISLRKFQEFSLSLVSAAHKKSWKHSWKHGLCSQRQGMDIVVLLSPTAAHMPDSHTPAVHAKLPWFCLGDPSSISGFVTPLLTGNHVHWMEEGKCNLHNL